MNVMSQRAQTLGILPWGFGIIRHKTQLSEFLKIIRQHCSFLWAILPGVIWRADIVLE